MKLSDNEMDLLLRDPLKMYRVFAPNGTTVNIEGRLGLRRNSLNRVIELFIANKDGEMRLFSKRVAIVETKNNFVAYDPRTFFPDMPIGVGMPDVLFMSQQFLTPKDHQWLRDNPQWPAELELYDNPVSEGDSNGLDP